MNDSWRPDPDAALRANAALHRRDANLERLAALRDADPDRFARLPLQAQNEVGCYVDMRDHHDQAVALGLITGGEAS